MMMFRSISWTMGLLAALIAAPAMAQYQLGDGRLLDRNLQEGSGGVNAPRQGNPYGSYQNAVITGNVGGLARFRGDVGYRAPGEFTGSTAADDLYQFSRTTLPTVPITRYQERELGVRGGQQSYNPLIQPYRNDAATLYRPGSGVMAGQVTGAWQPQAGMARNYDTTAAGVNNYGPQPLRALVGERIGREPLDLGVTADDRGQLLRVTASPLLGVQRERVGEIAPPEQVTIPSRRGETGERQPADSQPDSATPGERQRPDARQLAQPGLTERRMQQQDDRLMAPSLIIGERLSETPREAVGGDRRLAATAFRADVVEEQIFRPEAAASSRPGEDVYFDLLRKIGDKDDRQAGADQPGAIPRDQLAVRRLRDANDTVPGVPGAPKDSLVRRPGEQNPQPPVSNVRQLTEQFERAARGGDQAQADRAAAERLAGKLNYKLPPLSSFAGPGATAFNQTMAQAEQAMEAGRYFDAETLYARALALRPGYPLAEIGRIHAQLAAGLYSSAGMNLRVVLARHPELIAARYAQPLLPQTRRLEEIEKQLERLMTVDDRPDAALTLAYLAYQRENQWMLEQAMTSLIERSPDDPLPRLLWHVWLPEKPVPQPKPSTPATPGQPPGSSPDSQTPATPPAR